MELFKFASLTPIEWLLTAYFAEHPKVESLFNQCQL